MKVKDALQEWFSRLPRLAARWRAGELAAGAFAALYFFHWQIALHGQAFASRKRKRDARPEVGECLAALEVKGREALLLDYLERYQFRGVIANVPVALGAWLRGHWPLVLREDIPSPRDILRAQARGVRVVTAITAYPRLLKPVLNKPNAFAFFLHDLEHAYKFFHAPSLYAGQRAFFAALETAVDRDVFAPYFGDPVFVEKFHYLMSDMNTHPEHSRGYLRAILIEYYLRGEGKPLTAPLPKRAQRAIDRILEVFGPAVPCAAC